MEHKTGVAAWIGSKNNAAEMCYFHGCYVKEKKEHHSYESRT